MLNFHYQCVDCQQSYPFPSLEMVCPQCSSKGGTREPLRGVLQVVLTGKITSLEDVRDWLPVPKEFYPSIPVGNTPLWGPIMKWGEKKLYLKDDTVNPTWSFKDRASYLVAAFAKWQGIKEIVAASTGNAGSSMAGIGANAGLKITLFLPAKAPQAKLAQALQYGANLILVDGTYDDAYDLSLEYVRLGEALSRNTGYNPLTIEGKKTAALEIVRDLGEAPQTVFVPTGDGVILAGLYKGFTDLKQMGLINTIPTLYAVQAEGSSALHKTFVRGDGKFIETSSSTLADSISVDVPRNGYHALSLLNKHKGKVITVEDQEILSAQQQLSKNTGLFVEPASAAAFAGFLKVEKDLSGDGKHVVLATGSGLKDIVSALKGVQMPTQKIKKLSDM